MSRFILTFAAGVVVGAVLGSLVLRVPSPNGVYEITRHANLTGPDGVKQGELFAGVAVVSPLELSPDEDIGWWAYVPVSFGTMDEAAQLVRFTGAESTPGRTGPMLNARPAKEQEQEPAASSTHEDKTTSEQN